MPWLVRQGATQAPGTSRTICDAANPYDNLPDHQALQACLDNYDHVLLQPAGRPGYVGYIVNDTIKIERHGTLLTTADNPHKANIVAGLDLSSSMLRALDVNDFEISFIRFNGNRDARLPRVRPCDAVRNYRNVELSGLNFKVRYVESSHAICGAGMTVGNSERFEIYGSLFYDNGLQPEDVNGVSGFWADGLTVFKCVDATVRDNDFWDNTDVDLGVNGGRACSVYRNTVTHTSRYAFAGIVAGDPSREGGEFSDNIVTSGYNLLGFGILVGCHPWPDCGGGYATNLAVYDNVAVGAVVNLAVDGLNGGTVRGNVTSGAQGNRLVNCSGEPSNYTIGHTINVAPLQSGYLVRLFDYGSSCR